MVGSGGLAEPRRESSHGGPKHLVKVEALVLPIGLRVALVCSEPSLEHEDARESALSAFWGCRTWGGGRKSLDAPPQPPTWRTVPGSDRVLT